MADETNKEFSDRRALDEKAMADSAADVVGTIAHEQLSALHAQEAVQGANRDIPRTTALDVKAANGLVTVKDAEGDVMRLTPNAAALTSDLLLTVAREAGRQLSHPPAELPQAPRPDPTAAERAR